VALRHTNNPHNAQEISQAVFIILARKAGSLGGKTILSGWLYHAARLTAANFRRAEWRRARNEQEAFMQTTLEATTRKTSWEELAPLLDDVVARLGKMDRDAIVLRYFENKSLREVAATLGVEERAAQKRVSRALEKLRGGFSQRGVVWPATLLAGIISANSVQAAPAALAGTISATALKGSAGAGTTLTLVKGTLHVMNSIKLKLAGAIVASSVLVAGATVVLTHHKNSPEAPSQSQAMEDKLKAERESATANGPGNPTDANKLEDEQKALHAKQG
jgi:RNA polymerase sigma factor (sigma-70 family)